MSKDSKRNPWDLEAEAVPRSDIPKLGRSVKGRVLRIGLWGSVICMPLILMFGAATVNNTLNPPQAPAVSGTALTSSPGQAEARIAVDAWITDQKDSDGLRDARIVDWSGSAPVKTLDDHGVATYAHTFDVQTSDQGLLQVTQNVNVDTRTGVATASSTPPTMQVQPRSTGVTEADGWAGFEAPGSDPGVDSAVETWAKAYVSGASENVRVTMQDPDAGHEYPVLTGVQSISVSVTDVGQKSVPDGASKKDREQAAQWGVARAEITVVWDKDRSTTSDKDSDEPNGSGSDAKAGGGDDKGRDVSVEDSDDSDSAESKGTTFTVDLRLDGMDTGTPRVTAWGSPGQGPDLKDFDNAYQKAEGGAE